MGDFEEPDEYATRYELVGFLVITLAGPIILLNLLIALMGDA